jgi:hypothetical protein
LAVAHGLVLALPLDIKHALTLKLEDLTEDDRAELQTKMANPSGYRWPRPNGDIRVNKHLKSTVWGESCVGKRHFDCIGFINWCFSIALQKEIQYGIPNFTGDTARGLKPLFSTVPLKDAQLCDIVTIGAEHIGIVTEGKTVIEAKEPISGVVESPLDIGRWKQCFRLPEKFWRTGA